MAQGHDRRLHYQTGNAAAGGGFQVRTSKGEKQKSSASKSSVLTVNDGKCDATVLGHYVLDCGATRPPIHSSWAREDRQAGEEQQWGFLISTLKLTQG